MDLLARRPGTFPGFRLLAALLLLTVTGCGLTSESGPNPPGPTVLAASSLTDVFTELAEVYEQEHPGEEVTLSFAASSSLREQVLAGAPADVVALADDEMGEALHAAGTLAGPPQPFARNRMVIVVPEGNPDQLETLADLDRSDLLLGVCAAQVPCGALARRVLRAAGLDVHFTSHEPNARSLLTKVEERELDAGLVYRTDAMARPAVDAVTPPDLPTGPDLTAVYTIAPVRDRESGTAFLDLALSPPGQEILATHGFTPP